MGYTITASESNDRDFVPCPDGEHHAVCIDVVDLGMETNNFTGKLTHKMRLVWETEATTGEVDDNGQPIHFTVSQRFTVSLHEKSNLLPFINKWRGKALTADEVRGFDVEERLIGASGRIMVSQSADLKSPDKIWANVDLCLPPKKKVEPSGRYTRKKDREGYVAPPDSPWTPKAAPVAARPQTSAHLDGPRGQRQASTQQPQRPQAAAPRQGYHQPVRQQDLAPAFSDADEDQIPF
jgi:hypothetical protein